MSDPAKLEAIRAREADITKEKIGKLIAAGANVILTTKGIDDLCMKYLVEAGVIGIRRVSKQDIRRIGHATGATLLPNLADLEGGETVDPATLGSAESVSEERVGDGELIFIRGPKTSKSVSVVLRGANEFLLDEMDRSLHDTLCVLQRVLESRTLVAGGGSVEAALSVYLDAFATTLGTKEQLAIKEFADALLVIPKTLAVNAAQVRADRGRGMSLWLASNHFFCCCCCCRMQLTWWPACAPSTTRRRPSRARPTCASWASTSSTGRCAAVVARGGGAVCARAGG